MRNLVIPEIAPQTYINTIFCIGRNYAEHAEELGNKVPDEPVVFIKPNNTIVFDGGLIMLPARSKEVHHEVEMVVAIEKEGKNIKPEKADEYILGYGIGIDVTARDIQSKAKSNAHPWSVSKGFDTFAPISRFVSADEIEDPQNLQLKLEVNGEILQDGNTSDMIFPVNQLIAYLSEIFTLSPGDLIFTGTPPGVSPIQDGDRIKASLGDDFINMNLYVMNEPSYSI